jgi:hypothetical protein
VERPGVGEEEGACRHKLLISTQNQRLVIITQNWRTSRGNKALNLNLKLNPKLAHVARQQGG